MTNCLQLFFYRTVGLNQNNNFPMIRFDTCDKKHMFVNILKSRKSHNLVDEPYFVINNPQLLPDDVRKPHMHEVVEYDEAGESHNRWIDDCYSLRDNLKLLKNCWIDNNTNESDGLFELLSIFK
jgi:hypothetical protein